MNLKAVSNPHQRLRAIEVQDSKYRSPNNSQNGMVDMFTQTFPHGDFSATFKLSKASEESTGSEMSTLSRISEFLAVSKLSDTSGVIELSIDSETSEVSEQSVKVFWVCESGLSLISFEAEGGDSNLLYALTVRHCSE